MAQRQPLGDLLVVVPGILGSVLSHEGVDVWTVEARKLIPALTRFATTRRILELPPGIGDGAPDDGVEVGGLLPDLHAIPGLWTINGYAQLMRYLRGRFALTTATSEQAGNLVEFAYDWRLSNRLNGQRLATRVERELDRWRRQSGNDEAKAIFVCHSMGGLIARWCIDVLGGHAHTRKLITIGTPYQGAPAAIGALVNGVHKGLWPLRIDLTAMARSFPSIYQLLPVYPCVDPGSGALLRPTDCELPNLDPPAAAMVDDATKFHHTLADEAARHAGDYEIYALKGHLQPTEQIAHIRADGVEMDDREGDPDNPRGDGTVPRASSHPPEWAGEANRPVQGFAQSHASLQNTGALHASLHQTLTADRLGLTAGGSPISVTTPDLVQFGEPIPVVVDADADGLALNACIDEDTRRAVLLRNEGNGRYTAELPPAPPDAHTVEVYSASPLRSVEPVTTVVTVWGEAG